MPFQPGDRLGAYEILSTLGAGGMGVVYRARDARLGRDVAIKTLPDEVANDGERRARFDREARALAALSHPNVAAIFGFEQVGSAHLLVMELVEGETLADWIAHGPIPVERALPLFLQVASGVEAAHAKGIIHRDLKPANIKIAAGGSSREIKPGAVKILDFGLAKALAPDTQTQAQAIGASHSPTLTLQATMRGELLGTAGYMSPEQAEGEPADERADIWAFGVCLLEALSGRPVFEGTNASRVLASVLKDEPDLATLPAATPQPIRRLLRRCLEKDRDRRLHDIADARLEIEEAIAMPAAEDVRAEGAARATGRRWIALAAAALAGALLGTGAILLGGAPSRSVPPASYLNLALPNGHRLALAIGPSISISSDGRQIVYAGRDDSGSRLFHRSLDGTKVVPLPGTEGGSSVSFSPDGAVVAFVRGETLFTVGLDGESPRRVIEGRQIRGVAWDEEGRLLFGQRAGTLQRITPDRGKLEELLPKPDAGDRRVPEPVPGRNAVVFVGDNIGSRHSLQVVDLDDGEVRDLTHGTVPRFLSPEVLLWVRDGALWAGRFDARALELVGEPRRAVTGLATISGSGRYDVSDTGTLVYASGGETPLNGLVWVDRQGRRISLGLPPGDYQNPELSPDGSALLFTFSDESGLNIWTHDLDRGAPSRLTFGTFDAASTWSADGSRVYYASFDDARGIYSRAADGTGEVTLHYRAEAADGLLAVVDATPDGSGLILMKLLGNQWDILDLALADGSKPRPLLAESYGETSPELSPDGRWLAYQSDESGTWQVYVRPYPHVASGKWQVSTAGAQDPVWAPDGDELFFRRGRELRSVAVEAGPAFRFGPERLVLEVDAPVLGVPQYDAHPDGRFVLNAEEADSAREPAQIVVVERFDREVKRLLASP